MATESELQSEDCSVYTSSSCSSPTSNSSCVPPLLGSNFDSNACSNSIDARSVEITCSIPKALNLVNQMNGSFANPEPWLAKIVNVYVDSRIAKVLYYHKTGEEEDSTGMQTATYRPEKKSLS